MASTSSDVTPWIKGLACCRCGGKVLTSRQGFGCSFAGTGTVTSPQPTVWHWECPTGEEKA